jgi:alanyl-tRNA synthetase
MDSQLLYQQNAQIVEFDASVVEIVTQPDGRRGIVLDQTYFYPTGGGQEHDTGSIGSAWVVEVIKDEEHSRTVHVVNGEVQLGPVKARIDAERRLRHMQHHTAQHLLTQCLLRQTGFETISANINGYTPSTLDLLATQVSKPDLEAAELHANRIIYENRLVKTYFVTAEELHSIPLRRPPKVTDNIRIVEIDGYDYSACGGTHVMYTGSIGLIKVIKAERQNDRMRIYFTAGLQALEVFIQMYASINDLASRMSISWQDMPEVVGKQAEAYGLLQKDYQLLRQANARYEARQLVQNAEEFTGFRLLRKTFDERSVSELRMMAEELKQVPNLVSYLGIHDGQKLSLIVTCGEASGKDARQLLNAQLTSINGRGGGDARLAQGGGLLTVEQFHSFLNHIEIK